MTQNFFYFFVEGGSIEERQRGKEWAMKANIRRQLTHTVREKERERDTRYVFTLTAVPNVHLRIYLSRRLVPSVGLSLCLSLVAFALSLFASLSLCCICTQL